MKAKIVTLTYSVLREKLTGLNYISPVSLFKQLTMPKSYKLLFSVPFHRHQVMIFTIANNQRTVVKEHCIRVN